MIGGFEDIWSGRDPEEFAFRRKSDSVGFSSGLRRIPTLAESGNDNSQLQLATVVVRVDELLIVQKCKSQNSGYKVPQWALNLFSIFGCNQMQNFQAQ